MLSECKLSKSLEKNTQHQHVQLNCLLIRSMGTAWGSEGRVVFRNSQAECNNGTMWKPCHTNRACGNKQSKQIKLHRWKYIANTNNGFWSWLNLCHDVHVHFIRCCAMLIARWNWTNFVNAARVIPVHCSLYYIPACLNCMSMNV